jgi:WD40 repeat protein
VSEVVALKIGDIGSERMVLRVERGKGRKDRHAAVIAAARGRQRAGRVAASVAVHPKHPIIAAGFDEGRVIVCALSRQEKVVRLRSPDWDRVTALAWSRDGTRLAVGTETGAISLFDLSQSLELV